MLPSMLNLIAPVFLKSEVFELHHDWKNKCRDEK